MNIYLLEHFLRWVGMLFVSFISIFNVGTYDEYVLNVDNKNMDFGTTVVNSQPIVLQTQKEEAKPVEVQPPVVNTVEQEVVQQQPTVEEQPKEEVVPVSTTLEVMTGKLTGYGPDCAGCSGRGNLACKTAKGTKHNLYNDGIYYDDSTFGQVRIVAAAIQKFPCGTIIEIVKAGQQPITAVVLDRGGSMNSAFSKGTIWIDLAYGSTADAKVGGVSGLNYQINVKRWGW